LTVLLLELGDPSAKYRDQDIENISIDINLLSRWDVSPNLNNEMADFERTSERGLKALRKRCRELLTRLLTIVSLFALMPKLTDLGAKRLLDIHARCLKNISKHLLLYIIYLNLHS
jgi:hypothetical protein